MPPPNPLRIGLVLPLRGPQAPLGQAVQQAAMLAMFGNLPSPVALLFYDTTGDGGAVAAVQAAIGDGAQIILGPLFAAELRAVKASGPLAVPLLSLSNDWQQASVATSILGPTPQAEIPQSLQQLAQSGVRMLHILAPDTPYGQTVLQSAKNFAGQSALVIQSAQLYPSQNTAALQKAVEKLAADLPQPGTAGAEYHAVLIAETPARLAAMEAVWQAMQTQTGRSTMPRLIGLSLWAEADPSNFPILGQTLLPLPEYAAAQNFNGRYQQYFNAAPPGLAFIAYSAVQMLSRTAQWQFAGAPPAGWPALWAEGQPLDTEFGGMRQLPPGIWQRPLRLQTWRQGGF
jgi:hypothetical protein